MLNQGLKDQYQLSLLEEVRRKRKGEVTLRDPLTILSIAKGVKERLSLFNPIVVNL